MAIDIQKLVAALPVEAEAESTPRQTLQQLIGRRSEKAVPTGARNRLWILGSLQAKVAAAYLAHWLRAGFAGEDERERLRNEKRLKAALKVFGGMSYLRGAVMKLGQLLATYPDVLPDEFADVLGRLHFEAPPMHMSLLRELFRREIGADPEEVFEEFETRAFAAASLGQLHRARLRGSGRAVAVKIQYPNIARTIRDDFRSMQAILLPMRLSADWENLKEQFEDVRRKLDEEVDYMSACERAIEGPEEAVRHALSLAGDLTPRQAGDGERIALMKAWCDWVWEPMRHEGPFDFGAPDYFRRGTELYGEFLRHRYVRSIPLNTWLTRCFVGVRAILARLVARVDFRAIWKRETSVA